MYTMPSFARPMKCTHTAQVYRRQKILAYKAKLETHVPSFSRAYKERYKTQDFLQDCIFNSSETKRVPRESNKNLNYH